jgi:hypothetical protein
MIKRGCLKIRLKKLTAVIWCPCSWAEYWLLSLSWYQCFSRSIGPS